MNVPDYSVSLINARKLMAEAEELAGRKDFVGALVLARKARDEADHMAASLLLLADQAGQLPKRGDDSKWPNP